MNYNNGNGSDTEDYSTPTNDDTLSPFPPLNATQTTSTRHESSLNDLHIRHDSNASPEGQQQYTPPPELVQFTPTEDDIHFHHSRYNSSSEEDSSNHLSINRRIHNIERTLQSSLITPRRISEIEKALEKLQAEVAASHERIEGLRRDLNEREKNKRIINRSWSWFVKIMAKHAIINCVILAIIFAAYALRNRRRQLPIKDSWLQRLRMRNRKVKQFAKSALTDFKSTH
ncbi:19943_t:CDS:2 [Funneliformis geosporum]|uniref:8303_t:CDS:1 n=1 Tax=Funneliformis geosporum TaxID=1117311 RepID=A0A9W4SFQ4_9GLOM|nr:19943_t:CDS:2 [Funneliformis geosporum]CAI2167865.1 8303_t:CDS:2 [Funneliformis geosporum]